MRPGKNKIILRLSPPNKNVDIGDTTIEIVGSKNEDNSPNSAEVVAVGHGVGKDILPGDIAIFFHDLFYIEHGETIENVGNRLHIPGNDILVAIDKSESIPFIDRGGQILCIGKYAIGEKEEVITEKTPSGIIIPSHLQKRELSTTGIVTIPNKDTEHIKGLKMYAHRYAFGEIEYGKETYTTILTAHIAAFDTPDGPKSMSGYAVGEYDFEGYIEDESKDFLQNQSTGIFIHRSASEKVIGVKYMVATDIGDNPGFPCEAQAGDQIYFDPAQNGHEIHWDYNGKSMIAINMRSHAFMWRRSVC